MNDQSVFKGLVGGARSVFTLGPLRPAKPDRKLSVGRSRGMKQVEGDVADRHTLITLTHALHLVGSTRFSVRCSILLFA